MKFGKTAQLILAIGIVAIAVIFLYRMNLQKGEEYEQLNTQLETAQQLLPKLTSEKEALEGRLNRLQVELAQAQASLSEGKAKFPREIDGIDYSEQLFRMAKDRDLEVIRFTGSAPSTQSVEDVTYTVTSFHLEVWGEVADILDFVNTIATGDDFTTATVELVTITVPEPLTSQEKAAQAGQEETEAEAEAEAEAEDEEENPDSPSAVINVNIYSYEGE